MAGRLENVNWNYAFELEENIRWHLQKGAVVLLVGNKVDKVQERVIDFDSALRLASEHNVPYLETSVKLGDNV